MHKMLSVFSDAEIGIQIELNYSHMAATFIHSFIKHLGRFWNFGFPG
jgi:hypothetical protein